MVKIRIWKPLGNISGRYWLENVSLAEGKLVFVYKKDQQENTQVHVVCEGSMPSFMYTNETYIDEFKHLDSQEEIKAINPWSFYTVEDSSYLKKISDDSRGLSDYIGLKHYCIISEDERIDIVDSVEPVVRVVIDGNIVESS